MILECLNISKCAFNIVGRQRFTIDADFIVQRNITLSFEEQM